MALEPLFSIPPLDDEARLQLLYDRLSTRFGFGAAVIHLSNRKLTGGEIRYGNPHRITISFHLSEAERCETLRHEAAHAWAYQLRGAGAAHGELFRNLARRLGARGGNAPQTRALKEYRKRRQIAYRCEGCRCIFHRFRPFRGARHCMACWRAGGPSRLRRIAARTP